MISATPLHAAAVLLASTFALALPAVAQPVLPRAAAGHTQPVVTEVLAEPVGVYEMGMAITVSTLGAGVGSAGGALAVLLASSSSCGLDGCAEAGGVSTGAAVAGAVGGVVGAAVMVRVFGQEPGDYRGVLPYPGIRPDDWPSALLGALVGTVPGVLTAVLVGPTDSGLEWLAVPIAQGLGAGIAVSL